MSGMSRNGRLFWGAAAAVIALDVFTKYLAERYLDLHLPRQVIGDTVRWTDRSIGEPHTVTFLGGTEPVEDVILEPQPDGTPKLCQN